MLFLRSRESVPRRVFLTLVWTIGLAAPAFGQMEIGALNRNDPVYAQHQELVAAYHRAVAAELPPPPLLILSYRPEPEETLFEIAARLMLPYSSIATLNRLADTRIPGSQPLLIPSRPGIFLFEEPRSDLEVQLVDRLGSVEPAETFRLPVDSIQREVAYYPGTDFTPTERGLFLRVTFAVPLSGGVLSSPYGYRNHPITGIWSFHEGIDLAADFGTPVIAAAGGTVTAIARDPWLGLSVTIDHPGEYQTRYAHLQEVFVDIGTFVERGVTIGSVGSTGLSTGPHLHFEILYRGDSKDPIRYLPRESFQ